MLDSDKNIEDFILLSDAAEGSPYSQEYLSLLARRGKLEAKKIGRNWYTTQKSLDEYLISQGLQIVIPKTASGLSAKKRTVSKKELILLNTSPKINPLKP